MEYQVLSFYKYTKIPDPEVFTKQHLKFCKRLGMKTRILIAAEGINGVASGTKIQCIEYMKKLQAIPFIGEIEFKIDDVEKVALRKTHVRWKPEIVNSGLADYKDIDPLKDTGTHLSSSDFRKILESNEDVVIIDVRSNYETRVGKFKNAITLDIENFRNFPEKVHELDEYKNKKVITYCTGGIKCEKASALLKRRGFKDVFQLDGGIIKYSKKEGGKGFEGKCYVFDERVVVDVNYEDPKIISYCVRCGTPSSRMVNCAVPECNDQVILCESCGWEYEGTCSDHCYESATKRPYDGTGYYPKDKFLEIDQ